MTAMKKCSHSTHHALAELNITPLLDLAFVLLVIFIITTTPMVNDLELDLPKAANRPKETKNQVNYVTVDDKGRIILNHDEVQSFAELQEKLVALRLDHPDLNVIVRGAAKTRYEKIVGVMDALQQSSIGKVNLATEAFKDENTKKD